MKGTIKWFSNRKGYGVITRDDGVDYFVHHSNIVKNGFKTLHDGDIVSFEASRIDGTRIKAVNVKPILIKEMIENVLKENNLYLQTIRDIYSVKKYIVVDASNVLQSSEQGMTIEELSDYVEIPINIKTIN